MKKEVYTVDEIKDKLYISKNVAYNLVKQARETKELVVIKVGTLYRIPCEPFDVWLCKQVTKNKLIDKNKHYSLLFAIVLIFFL